MGIFPLVMQLTMKQYITAMRINHAMRLSDTDKDPRCRRLPGSDPAAVLQYFSNSVGMSPQQYRKLSQQRRQTMPGQSRIPLSAKK